MFSPWQLGRTHLSAETDPGLRASLQSPAVQDSVLPGTGFCSLTSEQLLYPVPASTLSTCPGSQALPLFLLGWKWGSQQDPSHTVQGESRPRLIKGPTHPPIQGEGDSRRAGLWIAGWRHTQTKPSREISRFNRPAYRVGEEQFTTKLTLKMCQAGLGVALTQLQYWTGHHAPWLAVSSPDCYSGSWQAVHPEH